MSQKSEGDVVCSSPFFYQKLTANHNKKVDKSIHCLCLLEPFITLFENEVFSVCLVLFVVAGPSVPGWFRLYDTAFVAVAIFSGGFQHTTVFLWGAKRRWQPR